VFCVLVTRVRLLVAVEAAAGAVVGEGGPDRIGPVEPAALVLMFLSTSGPAWKLPGNLE